MKTLEQELREVEEKCKQSREELAAKYRLRPVVIEVDSPFSASVRLQGTRQRYPFSWHGLHDWAAELFARSERERKKKERAERRKRS